MKELIEADYVILGGGVAGLSAARRLLELGVQPLVIEAGSYPSHKVCGEFFSPSVLPILKKWDIHPIPIFQARLHTLSQQETFHFPLPAGSLSHLTFDSQLADQISQLGGTVLTNTKVERLDSPSRQGEPHALLLSTGKQLLAKHLFIAAGRLPHFSQRAQTRYVGFKSHFEGIELNSTLEMFAFPGAYLGLSPIENGKTNLACLAKIERVQQASSSREFIETLIQSNPFLHNLLKSGNILFDQWMEALIPAFGFKSTPQWPRTYWIGDAAATIPPASGNGLSLALASGYLAAEFALKDDPQGFKHYWRKRCCSPILWGKGLHQLFLHPSLSNGGLQAIKRFPSISQKLFTLSRGTLLSSNISK